MASDIVFDPTKNAWCHLPSGACSEEGEKPHLPTYSAVADLLEKSNGSGIRLLGWTAARMVLIAPWFRLVGVPWKQAFQGAALASIVISSLTLLRISKTEYALNRSYLENRKWLKPRTARRRLTD